MWTAVLSRPTRHKQAIRKTAPLHKKSINRARCRRSRVRPVLRKTSRPSAAWSPFRYRCSSFCEERNEAKPLTREINRDRRPRPRFFPRDRGLRSGRARPRNSRADLMAFLPRSSIFSSQDGSRQLLPTTKLICDARHSFRNDMATCRKKTGMPERPEELIYALDETPPWLHLRSFRNSLRRSRAVCPSSTRPPFRAKVCAISRVLESG